MKTDLELEKSTRSLMEHIILGVAHEINNPNSFVRLNAMTLKKMIGILAPCFDEYDANHPDQKFGPYSLTELRSKMVQLTESLLDASVRIITVADKLKQCSSFALTQASPISVRSVTENVINMHRFLLEKWAHLDFVHAPDSPYEITGFGLQLEQALSILFTNACDAISERYPNTDEKLGKLRIALTETDTEVILTFSDNANGMDKETMDKIFTPYFTTKPQGVGDGLGLALCLAIIDRHGGKLEVQSEIGEGSTFTITLPKSSPTL